MKVDSFPKLWYNAKKRIVQRNMGCRWYESSLLLRRTSLEIKYNWKVSSKPHACSPLVEIYDQQTIPNGTDGIQQRKIWESRTKASWLQYQGSLGYKKAVCKYPMIDFTCAPKLWIVSDGGLCRDLGYYGWVIANDTSIIWEGRGQVPENHQQFDSLRYESGGFLHALKVLHNNIIAHDNAVQAVTLASDNKVLTDRVEHFQAYRERSPITYVKPHMDIQCQIDRVLTKLNHCISNINVLHVRGHQDTKKKHA